MKNTQCIWALSVICQLRQHLKTSQTCTKSRRLCWLSEIPSLGQMTVKQVRIRTHLRPIIRIHCFLWMYANWKSLGHSVSHPVWAPSLSKTWIVCHDVSLWADFLLKVTYHENLTFSVFKCYNRVPDASTNPENVKKNNPVKKICKLFSASLWKNERVRFHFPHDIERRPYYNIT